METVDGGHPWEGRFIKGVLAEDGLVPDKDR